MQYSTLFLTSAFTYVGLTSVEGNYPTTSQVKSFSTSSMKLKFENINLNN